MKSQTRIPNERDKVAAALSSITQQEIGPYSALTEFVMEQKNGDYYRGARTVPEAKELLQKFKQAAEAKLPLPMLIADEPEAKGYNLALKQTRATLRSVSMEDIQDA